MNAAEIDDLRRSASSDPPTERSGIGGTAHERHPLRACVSSKASAFVAAPLGGMTLAQLGADVIRFDPIGGGLDYRRWPVTADGRAQPLLDRAEQGEALDRRGLPESPRPGTAHVPHLRAGPDAGIFSTNFPAKGWLSYEQLSAQRADLIMVNLLGRRDGGSEVDYTVNPAIGFPALTGPADSAEPVNHVFPAWDAITGQHDRRRHPGRRTAPHAAPAQDSWSRSRSRTSHSRCWGISA